MEKSRIAALVDSIFAVAMTLLVLDLKLPEGVKISDDAEVWRQLVELKSRFAIYVMSFIVLGVHWVGHHSLFHFVRRVDRGLISETLHRGVRRFVVTVPKHGGGRTRSYFKTEKRAKSFVDQQKVDLLNHGTVGNSIPLKLRVEALEAQKILEPYGIGILAAAQHYVQHAQQITASVTVTHAKDELLKARAADGMRARYLGDLRVRLGRFEKDFGSRSIATITGAEADSWLRS